ncbi:MAG TPA: hypothetical protein VH165_15920, partial [Kofleriaceae bacterium]|nr:hypothetical protein [Kofleriaceae bacterium]
MLVERSAARKLWSSVRKPIEIEVAATAMTTAITMAVAPREPSARSKPAVMMHLAEQLIVASKTIS